MLSDLPVDVRMLIHVFIVELDLISDSSADRRILDAGLGVERCLLQKSGKSRDCYLLIHRAISKDR